MRPQTATFLNTLLWLQSQAGVQYAVANNASDPFKFSQRVLLLLSKLVQVPEPKENFMHFAIIAIYTQMTHGADQQQSKEKCAFF